MPETWLQTRSETGWRDSHFSQKGSSMAWFSLQWLKGFLKFSPKRKRLGGSPKRLHRWACEQVGLTVSAVTKSEARAVLKRELKLRGRLPVGFVVVKVKE